MRSLTSTIKGRAAQQAGANTETHTGEVTRLYADANDNIVAADVRLNGQPYPLIRVENASGLRLWRSATCTVAWLRGSRFAPSIIGIAGGGQGSVLASAAATVQDAVFGGTTDQGPDLSGVPMLLWDDDATVPDGKKLVAGANVAFEDADPEEPSPDPEAEPPAARRFVDVRVLAVEGDGPEDLPPPSGLRDGLLADVTTPAGEPRGMYRLDAAAGVWRRRDSGGGLRVDSVAAAAAVTLAASSGTLVVLAGAGSAVTLPPAASQGGLVLVRATGAEMSLLAAAGETIEGAAGLALSGVLPSAAVQALAAQNVVLKGLSGGPAALPRRCVTLAPDPDNSRYVIAGDVFAG